mmetsp:Transcript_658/g.2623  ORF Transcript_658/g.2623 Transcript_658/m.2623 type:complete len:224 (+) Transcript_658:1373-2044(+)
MQSSYECCCCFEARGLVLMKSRIELPTLPMVKEAVAETDSSFASRPPERSSSTGGSLRDRDASAAGWSGTPLGPPKVSRRCCCSAFLRPLRPQTTTRSCREPSGHMILNRSTSISVGVPTSLRTISILARCLVTNLTYVAGGLTWATARGEPPGPPPPGVVGSEASLLEPLLSSAALGSWKPSSRGLRLWRSSINGFTECRSSSSWCVAISLMRRCAPTKSAA